MRRVLGRVGAPGDQLGDPGGDVRGAGGQVGVGDGRRDLGRRGLQSARLVGGASCPALRTLVAGRAVRHGAPDGRRWGNHGRRRLWSGRRGSGLGGVRGEGLRRLRGLAWHGERADQGHRLAVAALGVDELGPDQHLCQLPGHLDAETEITGVIDPESGDRVPDHVGDLVRVADLAELTAGEDQGRERPVGPRAHELELGGRDGPAVHDRAGLYPNVLGVVPEDLTRRNAKIVRVFPEVWA